VGAVRNEPLLEALAERKGDAELKRLLGERRALRRQFDQLPASVGPQSTPLERVLRDTRGACEAAGARLVVVALHLDVMVSDGEWKKYVGSAAIDLSATKVLRDDLVARAQQRCVSPCDDAPPCSKGHCEAWPSGSFCAIP
jgi:hypothetical protein